MSNEFVTPSLSGRRALLKSMVTVPGCRSRPFWCGFCGCLFRRGGGRRLRRAVRVVEKEIDEPDGADPIREYVMSSEVQGAALPPSVRRSG